MVKEAVGVMTHKGIEEEVSEWLQTKAKDRRTTTRLAHSGLSNS